MQNEGNKSAFTRSSYLLIALEDVALEDIGGAITSDVREDLEIGTVVRYIEYAIDGMMHYFH